LYAQPRQYQQPSLTATPAINFSWNGRVWKDFLPEVKVQLVENASPMDIFERVAGLDELIEMVVTQTNLYVQQNGRNFEVDAKEMNAFLRINYIMAINKLQSIAEYWRVDEFIGNSGIQTTMIRNRFVQILQNLHFADNTEDDHYFP